MFRRWTFLGLCFLSVGGLGLWSLRLSARAVDLMAGSQERALERQLLLETLDRLVADQHAYRSVHGSFTRLLGKIGFELPRSLSQSYDVRVVEASSDQLRIVAFSEKSGQIDDFVTLDQDFQIHSNFPIPTARPEYLRSIALRALHRIREEPLAFRDPEPSLYRGYFKFEVQYDSENQPVVSALGEKFPVQGMRVESEVKSLEQLAFLGTPGAERATALELETRQNLGVNRSLAEAGVEKANKIQADQGHSTEFQESQSGAIRTEIPSTELEIEPIPTDNR